MNPATWELARTAVERGELVAFPTDTVYGVACDPYNPTAIELLYRSKGRQREKAIPLLLAGVAEVASVTRGFPSTAELLGKALWPGALTLVVPRSGRLPRALSGTDTIAVRVPDHDELRNFIASCGGALATTSANLSGRPDALTAKQVEDYLGEHVAVIIDGGRVPGGVPSTVVDCVSEPPRVLRAGALGEERIREVLGEGASS